MKKDKAILSVGLAMFLLFFCYSSYAFVFGGSNLGFMGYPEFSEYPPQKPRFSPSEYDVERYYDEVKEYKRKLDEYSDNAESDIQRIQEAVDDAISEYNRVVNEANSGW